VTFTIPAAAATGTNAGVSSDGTVEANIADGLQHDAVTEATPDRRFGRQRRDRVELFADVASAGPATRTSQEPP